MEQLSQEDWEEMLVEIQHTWEACIRIDCRVVQPSTSNRNPSAALWKDNIEFKRDYRNLVEKIEEVGVTFAPLRWVLLNADYTTTEKVKEADDIM